MQRTIVVFAGAHGPETVSAPVAGNGSATFPERHGASLDRAAAIPPPINRAAMSRMSDRLREAIEEEIATGKLLPGSRLDEAELAKRFNVSRTPIREALNLLLGEGLIEARPRRGAVVARVSPQRLIEMFEVMAELEVMCARLPRGECRKTSSPPSRVRTRRARAPSPRAMPTPISMPTSASTTRSTRVAQRVPVRAGGGAAAQAAALSSLAVARAKPDPALVRGASGHRRCAA